MGLQSVPSEQVHCHEATGVWLKHITYTVNHQSKKPIIYRYLSTSKHIKIIVVDLPLQHYTQNVLDQLLHIFYIIECTQH